LSQLLIFDIDGTLCLTNGIDYQCYVNTINYLTKGQYTDINLEGYQHYTDEYICYQLCRQYDLNFEEFKNYFHKNLQAQPADLYKPMPGGVELIQYLSQNKIPLVLATGCWLTSAHIKLNNSGYPSNLLISTSDYTFTRQEIVARAIITAEKHYGESFKQPHYFGDGLWDAQTCSHLNIPFYGVSSADSISALQEEMILINEKFPEPKKFLSLLK
jgi:phosphoglycolate phosphatase-like HAD superfamily hydrolase